MKVFQKDPPNGYRETRPDCCLRCRHSLRLEFKDPLECTKVSTEEYYTRAVEPLGLCELFEGLVIHKQGDPSQIMVTAPPRKGKEIS